MPRFQLDFYQCLLCNSFFGDLSLLDKHFKRHPNDEEPSHAKSSLRRSKILPIQKVTFSDCFVSLVRNQIDPTFLKMYEPVQVTPPGPKSKHILHSRRRREAKTGDTKIIGRPKERLVKNANKMEDETYSVPIVIGVLKQEPEVSKVILLEEEAWQTEKDVSISSASFHESEPEDGFFLEGDYDEMDYEGPPCTVELEASSILDMVSVRGQTCPNPKPTKIGINPTFKSNKRCPIRPVHCPPPNKNKTLSCLRTRRKQEANRKAAHRYRQKRMEEHAILLAEEQRLQTIHYELEGRRQALEREIRDVRALLREMVQRRAWRKH